MNYCKKCISTDLRPGGEFIDGLCLPCYFAENEQKVNYKNKLKLLKNLYKESQKSRRNKTNYDCIVGVSGGKDSTRQAHWVRDRLGLRPLLVCVSYPPKQMSEIGAKNLSNIIDMGFDLITVTPSPKTSCELSLESFRSFGNVSKSCEKALYSSVPRIAIDLGINTIFWGENNATQVGEKSVLGRNDFDANKLRKMNTLSSGGENWIFQIAGSKKGMHYVYPEEIKFKRKKINIYFLGPAWDDWSVTENSTYAALNGLTLRPCEEEITGDISNASMIDEEFTNINMMIKYYKFGFGRATDFVNEQIRLGLMSREEGIEIVKEYDGICDDSIINSYCNYVNIEIDVFWKIVYSYTNKNLFEIKEGIVRPIRKFKIV